MFRFQQTIMGFLIAFAAGAGGFLFLAALPSCGPPPPPDITDEEVSELLREYNPNIQDADRSLYRPATCDRRSDRSNDFEIEGLDFIDSSNIGRYALEGRCKGDGLIHVEVNGLRAEKAPKCRGSRWKMLLNLAPLANTGEISEFDFYITYNRETICRSARMAFIAPEKNYVPIEPIRDQHESSFYVMKYEAKLKRDTNEKAVSVPEGKPLQRVSYREAVRLCENNGSRYRLIENDQWQNIVLSIEKVNENWSSGRSSPTDNNRLNCGVARTSPKPASSNDSDDCAERECDSGWDENRRTHLLPGGHKIWDICGNVGEIMRDKYKLSESFKGHVHSLPRRLKKLFGPKRNYSVDTGGRSASRRDNNWNLGFVEVKSGKNLIIRGMPGRFSGIFSAEATQDQDVRRSSSLIGFRCVFIP